MPQLDQSSDDLLTESKPTDPQPVEPEIDFKLLAQKVFALLKKEAYIERERLGRQR